MQDIPALESGKGDFMKALRISRWQGRAVAPLVGVTAMALLIGVGATGTAGAAGITNGGTLIVGTMSGGTSESMSPASNATNGEMMRKAQLYDRFFVFSDTGIPELSVLKKYSVSTDGLTVTLQLRPDIKWSDGSKATADDMLWTFKTWSTSAFKMNGGLKASVDFTGIKKIDNLTIQIPMKAANPALPSQLASTLASFIKNGTEGKGFDLPIGTGPFKLVSWTPGGIYNFVANPYYWRTKLHLSKLVVNSSFTDSSALVNALDSGQIDAAMQIPFSAATIVRSAGKKLLTSTGFGMNAITMRTDLAPFNDPRVTLALKLIANRNEIKSNAYLGFLKIGNDLPGQGTQYFASNLTRGQDIAQAKALLKAAGKSDLTVTLTICDLVPGELEAGTLFAAQAKAAGVTVILKKVEAATYFSASAGWPYPMGVTTWSDSASTLAGFYALATGKGGYNETGFGDAAFSAKVAAASSTLDTAKAASLWAEIQTEMFNNGGYIVYGTPQFVDALDKSVRGLTSGSNWFLSGARLYKAWMD